MVYESWQVRCDNGLLSNTSFDYKYIWHESKGEVDMARILLVDDDPDFVASIRHCLERAGHVIASASNRGEGMRLVGQREADLLILDIMMEEPDDGLVMAQDLRKGGFKKPILMMSSISKVTGFPYGKDVSVTPVDDFVEKPLKPEVLLEKIDRLLKGQGPEDASC
ncbi:MAG: response regulator transcription factor [Planctomycetota bacterium]